MIDPVTIGSLVASALATAADVAFKGAVGEAVKDGYKNLKEKVSNWAPTEVASLEINPNSQARRAVLAEMIDIQSPKDKDELRVLAQELISHLKSAAPSIGLSINNLNSIDVQLGNIDVNDGYGAIIGDVNSETFKVGDISVNNRLGK